MTKITQGTVINGIRSPKYDDVDCYGIIITARCDLAQSKVNKVFFLTGVPLLQWTCSKAGFEIVIKEYRNQIVTNIKNEIQKYELDWDTLKKFDNDDFELIVEESIKKNNIKDKIKQNMAIYRKINSTNLTADQRKEILSEPDPPKKLKEYIKKVSCGSITHYVHIPASGMELEISSDGLIIDLQELDYFPYNWVKNIENGELDITFPDLVETDRDEYDKVFHIIDKDGYAYHCTNIKSPWIEYILQRFTNLFARIGVDNLSDNQIDNILAKSM